MTRSPRLRRLLAIELAYRDLLRLENTGHAYWHRRFIAETYFLRRMEAGRGRWVKSARSVTEYTTWGKHRRGPEKHNGRRRSRP